MYVPCVPLDMNIIGSHIMAILGPVALRGVGLNNTIWRNRKTCDVVCSDQTRKVACTLRIMTRVVIPILSSVIPFYFLVTIEMTCKRCPE